ncbi:selenocysteine-specific translation elongation factor [Erwinia aphidicola]|uniref:selenocysteine-specific translation elongation factor n=1 Tax=Erwinia aphidicola TaxID=68334 RepID=UPI0030177B1C
MIIATAGHVDHGKTSLLQAITGINADRLPEEKVRGMTIDRVFNVKGAGVVVTGTALCGSVSVGDALWLSGMNKAVRVRGLHAQNQPTERAQAGQRIALNLSGGVEKERVTRGDWLLSDAPAQPCDRLLVALTLHHALRQGQPLHLHHAASHITGRISLLQDNLAELLLDKPLWLTDNDRLILRDISARETLGAARVLLLTPPKRGKQQPAFIRWLKQLENADSAVEKVTLLLEQRPRTAEELEWLLQLSPGALSEVLTAVAPDIAGDYLLPQKDARQWQTELLVALENYHNEHDDRPGIGRDRLRRIALPNLPESLVLALIATLLDKQALRNNHGWLHLPDFEIGFDDREDALWQQVRPLFGDQAWWVRDLAAQAGCEEAPMRQLLRKAAQGGEIVAIVKDRYFAQPQIVRFADIIRERAASALSTSAADFRDRLGVGRKLAVQILEFFDRCGFTRRKGNEHLLRDGQMFR